MGLADFFSEASNDFHNKGSVTHDVIGGALAYEVAKKYEEHLAKNGKPDSHAKAKEVLAGLLGAAVVQFGETKGKDLWDERKKQAAIRKAEEHIGERVLQSEYGRGY